MCLYSSLYLFLSLSFTRDNEIANLFTLLLVVFLYIEIVYWYDILLPDNVQRVHYKHLRIVDSSLSLSFSVSRAVVISRTSVLAKEISPRYRGISQWLSWQLGALARAIWCPDEGSDVMNGDQDEVEQTVSILMSYSPEVVSPSLLVDDVWWMNQSCG